MAFLTSICVDRHAREMPDETSPRAILLDLGDVLIDIHFEQALQEWLRFAQDNATSAPVDARHRQLAAMTNTDKLALISQISGDASYQRHERGEIDFAEFASALNNELRLDLSEAQWRRGWNAVLGEALPGAEQLVRRAAKQCPVFLFSNTNATHQTHWLAQHQQLFEPMDALFVSNELGLRKPDAPAYQAVVRKIGIGAERIVFFDDRQDNIDGAKRAGLQAFRATSPDEVARVLGLSLPCH